MAAIEIRQLHGEELLDVLHRISTYAFDSTPPVEEKETWAEPMRTRPEPNYIAVYEDGKPMTGAASSLQTHNVRGKQYKAGGVWGVATLPEGRRKGYVRKAMEKLLALDRAEGKAFSALYPFRESFYERMGYVSFPSPLVVKFSPSALLPVMKMNLEGQVEMMPIAETVDSYRSYVVRMRAEVHGMTLFDDPNHPWIVKRNAFWLAMAKVDGELEGVMLYSLKGEEIAKFNMRCLRFCYRTSRAKYLLLDWIARHADQADRAEIWLPPYERPETWLPDTDMKIELTTHPPMGRVLDVPLLGGMQVGEGTFTARIQDPLCPWNEGVWRFENDGGILQVSGGGIPDCDLAIQGLTSLVYGVRPPDDFGVRGWGNPGPELRDRMVKMFPPKVPHLYERF